MNREANEDAVREEVSAQLGREVPDELWREMYARAKNKLRHIITHFGDADGARRTVDYIAQLTIEAIQAEALKWWCRGKSEEAGAKADPQGHTTIILQNAQTCQAAI